MTRSHLSLDGGWHLALDPDDAGEREQWHSREMPADGPVIANPARWLQAAAPKDAIAWCFREFPHAPEWDGQQLRLRFEDFDAPAAIWLNGQRIGTLDGGVACADFEISHALRPEGNRLALRMAAPEEDADYALNGVWALVSLLALPRAHLEEVFVQPDLRRKALAVLARASAEGEGARVHLQIEGAPHHAEGAPGALLLPFPDFEPWSPAHPACYTLVCRLVGADGAFDELRVRFGMREVTVRENRFHLNNRPFFPRGVWIASRDAFGAQDAGQAAAKAREALAAAKDAGFNLLRAPAPLPAAVLDIADSLGLLVQTGIAPARTLEAAPLAERCLRGLRGAILRDRNRPSVAAWTLPSAAAHAKHGMENLLQDLCAAARDLDPTRLIIDDGEGGPECVAPARFLRARDDAWEAYDDLRVHLRAPASQDIARHYRHNGDPGRLAYLSAFGYGGLEDPPPQASGEDASGTDCFARAHAAIEAGFAERNLDRVFGGTRALAEAARELQAEGVRQHVDAIRANPKLAGHCHTRLRSSGGDLAAGLLDRGGAATPALRAFKEAHAPLRPLIQAHRTNLALREEIGITVLLANDERLEGRADLSLQVVGPTQQVLWKKKRNVKIPRHGKELWSGAIAASGSPGRHKFVVRLMQGMKLLGENSLELHVMEPTAAADAAVNVLDPGGGWRERCHALSKTGNIQAPVHVIPPLANTIRGYPEQELLEILAQVEGGAVAIFFGPPPDWNALAERLAPDGGLTATSRDACGGPRPVLHYVKLHPVFEGLPARCLMRQPYAEVAPFHTFVERGGEDICGALDTRAFREHAPPDPEACWGNNLLVRRFGSGRVVFTHLRVLEHLQEDPAAKRLFVNIVNHFARRSVPPETQVTADPRILEWLRNQRSQHTRRWMVIGAFPNWNGGEGLEKPYPPERDINFEAVYPGWCKPVQWRCWHTHADDEHLLDFEEALSPDSGGEPRFDHGVGYAYAEFTCDRRGHVDLALGMQNAMKVWLNGKLVHEGGEQTPWKRLTRVTAAGYVRQGRNTLLVKCAKAPGWFRFSCEIAGRESDPLQMKWWR